MEYLLVWECFKVGVQPFWISAGRPWTSQMIVFAKEMSLSKEFERYNGIAIKGIDLDFKEVAIYGFRD